MGGITQSIAVLNCPMAQAVSSLCFLRSACLAMVVTYVCSVQCGLHVINVFCGGKCRSIWVGPNRPESWNLWVVHVPGVGATPGIQWSQWSYGAWCPFEQRTSCTPLDVFGCSIHLNHRPGLDSVRVGYVICSIDGPGFAGGRPAAIRCGEGRRPSKHASIHRISIRRLPMVPLLPNVV